MFIRHSPGENWLGNCLEEPYTYVYKLPSLQKLASDEICRAIWCCSLSKYQLVEAEDINVIHCHYMIGFHLFRHYRGHTLQQIKLLNVPSAIEAVLKNSMSQVCEEIEYWAVHFVNRTVHIDGQPGIRYIDPKWAVWSISGEIDHLKSAQNILQSGCLTEWQKFLVMSEYCMVDEIGKFSLDSLPPEFITEEHYSSKLHCFYWICCLKDELHRVPVMYNNSIDITLAKFSDHFRYAREFFWDHLSDGQQVQLTAVWISGLSSCRDTKECDILEKLISKMSPYQQQCLLRKTSIAIISGFASWSNSSKCALWAWKYAKNKMDAEQFATLVHELLRNQMAVERYEIGEWSCNRKINPESTSILDEIWNTASAQQKNQVIQTKLDEFVDNLLRDNGTRFSDQFLQFVSEDQIKKLIFRSVDRSVIQACDLNFLNSFLNLYLPCSDDQLTFRKLVINSSAFIEHLKYLLLCKDYKEFNEVIKFYFSHDTLAAKLFKREFLDWKLKNIDFTFDIRLITSVDIWNKLSEFIDEVFDEDPKSRVTVKQWFIKSTLTYNIRVTSYTIVSELSKGFDDLVKIVETVFTNDELKNVKRLFSDEFRSLFSGSFRGYVKLDDDDVFLLKFMRWCSIHDGKPILESTYNRASLNVTNYLL